MSVRSIRLRRFRNIEKQFDMQEASKESIRQNILINSKCLKGRKKFKIYFNVIKPTVKYELLPLDVRIQMRLDAGSSMDNLKETKEKEPSIETVSTIGHLCTKRIVKKKLGRKVEEILKRLELRLCF